MTRAASAITFSGRRTTAVNLRIGDAVDGVISTVNGVAFSAGVDGTEGVTSAVGVPIIGDATMVDTVVIVRGEGILAAASREGEGTGLPPGADIVK